MSKCFAVAHEMMGGLRRQFVNIRIVLIDFANCRYVVIPREPTKYVSPVRGRNAPQSGKNNCYLLVYLRL
jgi:hypothetical protein